ncbi:MAG: exodeoxyribonuclease V subunit alpha [Azoarcus sp.]|jgi:exodeoxyribonuclease V alpha subunit|nr:exodeoxyribonuclease V subunit alpha [Azoarcus sp.]
MNAAPQSETWETLGTLETLNAPPAARRARDALADGLARQIGRWARAQGSESADVRVLVQAVQKLALAACDGHVCLPLARLGSADVAELRRVLLGSGMAIAADSKLLPARAWPLVLDGERLYLRVYFDLETRLARALRALAADFATDVDDDPDDDLIRAALDVCFPPRPGGPPDWQKVAAALALTQRLTIVSGGPGTGKTTTVAALIACLLALEPGTRIALAAPTGKAAARLREALAARARDLPEAVRLRLPAEAYTVHRLLGPTSTPGRFRHDAAHPLALDLLVIDEASMLDLALAAALLDALPTRARLVLLGDKDQLSAVEAGAVFADLSAGWRLAAARATRLAALTGAPVEALMHGSSEPATLPDCVVWLTESHRFRADSGIGRLARDIGAGEGAAALARLRARTDPAVTWIEDEQDAALPPAALAAMAAGYGACFAALQEMRKNEPPEARAARVLQAFERFRVLVAVHDGPRGLAAINARLTQHARAALGLAAPAGPFWPGRPLIVLKNDPVTKLFNGDIGICLPDPDGTLRVWFPTADGAHRALSPQRLPEHDTAFALTVHKSQGSEFAEVLLLLPARTVRVLSRELLYTALTRAAQRVTIVGNGAVFAAGCAVRSERFSGLGGRLGGG